MTESDCQHIDLLISGWGERYTIMWKSEPEFGLCRYREIVNEELNRIDDLINCQGVGKGGEKYVRLILPPPSVRLVNKNYPSESRPCKKPQWKLRYSADISPQIPTPLRLLIESWRANPSKSAINWFKRKAAIILEFLIRLTFYGDTARLFRLAWKVVRRISRLPRKNLMRDAKSPVAATRCLTGENGSFKSQHIQSNLANILSTARLLVCASEEFLRDNGRLIKGLSPTTLCQLLSTRPSWFELSDCVRVPLRRYSLGSFEAWAYYQAVDCPADSLLVVDEKVFVNAIGALQGTLLPEQRVILVADNLTDEITRNWKSCTQISDRLWLMEGPPQILLRPPLVTEPPGGWPKISIVTISYNQGFYIKSCLDSILDQGYPNLEYIVIDGGSTDGTKEILEQYRDQLSVLIIEPDQGQSDALNKGFQLATGDVMNWICSDDCLEPGSLFCIGRAFAENEVDLVAGGCRVIDTSGRRLYDHHNGLPFNRPVDLSFGDLLSFLGVWQRGMFFFQPEVFFSRKIWEASGGYIKEHLYFAMDYDLFLRMAMAGAKILHIPYYVGVSRKHKDQKTQHENMLYLPTIRALLEEYRRLIDKAVELLSDDHNYDDRKKI